MYTHYNNDYRTDKIILGSNPQENPPFKVRFIRADGTCVTELETEAFQLLRRAVYVERGHYPDGTEHKIWLIKTLRGLTGLGLKDSKEIVEYFLNNFTRDCGLRTGDGR